MMNPDAPKTIEGWLKQCGPLLDMVRVAQRVMRMGNLMTLLVTSVAFLIVGMAAAGSSDSGGAVSFMFGTAAASLVAGLLSTHGLGLLFRESDDKQELSLFLRSFRTDKDSETLRAWLKAAMGKKFRLSGIRPPRERTRKWVSLLYPMLTGLRYVGAAQFQLEAPDRNWMARLLGSFAESRFVFIDARDVTTHVHDEIRLAWAVFGAERILFIVDERRTRREWEDELCRLVGQDAKMQGVPVMRQLVWPSGGRTPEAAAFAQEVRSFVESLPHGTPEIPAAALEFTRARVADESWASRMLEKETPFVWVALILSLALGVAGAMLEMVQMLIGVVAGVVFQVLCWAAWFRARRHNLLTKKVYPKGAVSSWRLWKAFLCLSILPVVTVMAILASLAIPVFNNVKHQAQSMKAISNAKQINMTMKMYANNHAGSYPDGGPEPAPTANKAFRRLFQEDIVSFEPIFGAVTGENQPDNRVGDPPDYAQALEPGENHWAMTAGLTDTSPGALPLIYDTPARASWPPAWTPPDGIRKLGDATSKNEVVVSFNDGRTELVKLKLEPESGLLVPADPAPWMLEGPKQVLLAEPTQ